MENILVVWIGQMFVWIDHFFGIPGWATKKSLSVEKISVSSYVGKSLET